ncbi:MAG TPA: hypothetical protein VFG33_40665 [Kribbella sp.]|uniref:hypothetical protein n=1 Tax=Kribbella sp. TaxID=1871183 RepID=UPI002D7A1C7B|nr:hypothetical protein [Kribbella sp.]HET6299745.1 hypothetical protein [Kribbella sp.]
MLLSALFLHNALPHTAAAPIVSIERTAERLDGTEWREFSPARSPEHAPENDAEQIGLPISALQLTSPAPASPDKAISVGLTAPSDTVHSQLARDHRTRSIQRPPTPISLQIFRC